MKPVVYQYPACSTCRKALKWLDARGVVYEATNIVDKPPSEKLLKKALASGCVEEAFKHVRRVV